MRKTFGRFELVEVPVVNLNGTSRQALIEGVLDCDLAIVNAMQVLRQNSPHGRDYPSLGSIERALADHRSRLDRLEAIQKEFQAIGDHLCEVIP